MKLINTLTASAVAVSALATGATAMEAHADAIDQIVDRTLASGDGTFLSLRSDNTLRGQIGGNALDARWQSANGLFCSQGSAGDIELGHNCVTVSIDGDNVTFFDEGGAVTSSWELLG